MALPHGLPEISPVLPPIISLDSFSNNAQESNVAISRNFIPEEHDYNPPPSPRLEVFRPKLTPDNFDLEDTNYQSDSDEELDVNLPWESALRSKPNNYHKKRRRADDEDRDPGSAHWGQRKSKRRGDEFLMNVMGSTTSLLSKMDHNVLFEPLPGAELALPEQDIAAHKARLVAFSESAFWKRGSRIGPQKRIVLPLIVQGKSGPIEIVGYPDTGSDENIISLEVARDLGLQVEKDEEHQGFMLANGKKVTAIGKASLPFNFRAGNTLQSANAAALECTVYVFHKLIAPALLGAVFLTEHEIYTKQTHRLMEKSISSGQPLRVNSVGTPKNGLVCRLDSVITCAIADTGSDVNLVSPQFAREGGFKIEPNYEELEFADGSKTMTSGMFVASFSVGNIDPCRRFHPCDTTILNLSFRILDGLSSDVLVGWNTLEQLEVFNRHSGSLVQLDLFYELSSCNPIRLIGEKEGKIRSTYRSVKDFFKPTQQHTNAVAQSSNNAEREQKRLLDMQRENARQEATAESESKTSNSLKDSSLHPTSSEKTSPRLDSCDGTLFQCTFPGCTAWPFRTEHLVQSHVSKHTYKSSWPQYFPFSDNSRSEGSGLRLKREVTRDGLHDTSIGYLCPFCPDREQKYPRPDNLRRHVRVHHVDKSKDDPQLRDVLTQRPEGLSRGRMRRGPPQST